MSHRIPTPKDGTHPIDPDCVGFRPNDGHYAPPIDHAERARVEA